MHSGLIKHKTRTGTIFCDTERRLEFLGVGDYGKASNIKADFLGLTQKIDGVEHKAVSLHDKWVVTLSTQKGCHMKCNFCDAHKYGYYGNVSVHGLKYQLATALINENEEHTKRLNVHYARMGEPTFNRNVLAFDRGHLDKLVKSLIVVNTIHPVISPMMPKNNTDLYSYLYDWCSLKNKIRNGEAGLQLSINSTCDKQRAVQFNGESLSLSEISEIAGNLPVPAGRKYTLNFAVTKDTILDAKLLTALFDRQKFIVKLTPIHLTAMAQESKYDLSTTYDSYDVYAQFEQPLLDLGWDVIVFVPSKEEDEDRITCGNALLATMSERN